MKIKRRNRLEEVHFFWHETTFFCPHCKKTFLYKEMWTAAIKKFKTVVKISSELKRNWKTVRAAVRSLSMDLEVNGTEERLRWKRIAKKAGYSSPRKMFYHMKVVQRMSPKKMAQFLNIDKDKVKEACRKFLEGG